jgi:hypothetical protein
MGTFLHIGLRVRLSASKPDSPAQRDALRTQLANATDLSMYDEQETAGELVWTLKPALIERELVPFLRKQFSLIPAEGRRSVREEMLAELAPIKTVDELQTWCDETESYFGHWDNYDELTIGEGRQRQHIAAETFVFVSEGKIMMETYGGVFEYVENLIALANPAFQLAKAASVSISG